MEVKGNLLFDLSLLRVLPPEDVASIPGTDREKKKNCDEKPAGGHCSDTSKKKIPVINICIPAHWQTNNQ